uniref:Mediator of RNA polymerase II transcription subunit 20 n=1 Tax=Ananas comosus var. bracteatus TaxID=296719 RepID=A0A6V7P3A0_ANACO|nr:unnamed protein product [Ananas comosus var. bracteatus]
MTVKCRTRGDAEQPDPGGGVRVRGGARRGQGRAVAHGHDVLPPHAARLLRAPADVPRDFLGLALHDRPDTYFFILRAHRLVLHADASIQAIMEKLQSYKARVVFNFEGFQYKLGDFRLRVGKCVPSMAETLRGIMMEVEYLPLSSIEKSRQILEEFFDIWQEALAKKSLPGHFIHIESNFADYGLQDHYTSQHTAVQYATCMAQLMAAVRS